MKKLVSTLFVTISTGCCSQQNIEEMIKWSEYNKLKVERLKENNIKVQIKYEVMYIQISEKKSC